MSPVSLWWVDILLVHYSEPTTCLCCDFCCDAGFISGPLFIIEQQPECKDRAPHHHLQTSLNLPISLQAEDQIEFSSGVSQDESGRHWRILPSLCLLLWPYRCMSKIWRRRLRCGNALDSLKILHLVNSGNSQINKGKVHLAWNAASSESASVFSRLELL